MADVRLTATNPEDSSVVPVACDASGRLLLQELPPAFDGTVDGDLTVSGKGTFADSKSIIGDDGSAQFAQGAVDIYANGVVDFAKHVVFESTAAFSNHVSVDQYFTVTNTSFSGQSKVQIQGDTRVAISVYDTEGVREIELYHNGAVSFAGDKAGFTAEGYLWCTTRRGDTVILDATSNGLASWVEYTPTSRIDDLRDKLDANRPDTGEMPADTP